MKSILLLLASLGCLAPVGVYAQTYKCVLNGNASFSDAPCPPGAVSTVLPAKAQQGDTSAESARELARMQQRLETMQRERQVREAADAAALEEEAVPEESGPRGGGGGGRDRYRSRNDWKNQDGADKAAWESKRAERRAEWTKRRAERAAQSGQNQGAQQAGQPGRPGRPGQNRGGRRGGQ